MDDLQAGTVTPVKQDDTKSNYAKMLKKELGNIDFNQEAVKIERLIRGLNPWPSAYTKLADKTLKIWDADVVDKDYEGENGEIVEVTKDYFVVKTGSKSLKINELQLEGKKRMKSDIFLRGNKLEKGVVLK